jgi:hypothetical protein
MTKMDKKTEELATTENAAEYAKADDGCFYVFCLDLLELNADDHGAEKYVNALEDKFDALNGFSPVVCTTKDAGPHCTLINK